jgi:transaldolase
MSLLLDSANINEAKKAAEFGFINGVTTNPALLAATGTQDVEGTMTELCGLFNGPVFYQLRSSSIPEMLEEAERFKQLAPNLALKILCSIEGFTVAAELSPSTTVAITAVFTASQAYLAAQSGADFAIPYVNRLNRFTDAGIYVLQDMHSVLQGEKTSLLAAGIKSRSEALESYHAGATHLSLPLSVIENMAYSELTEQAKIAFDEVVL